MARWLYNSCYLAGWGQLQNVKIFDKLPFFTCIPMVADRQNQPGKHATSATINQQPPTQDDNN